MNIQELITLTENRLNYLNSLRIGALQIGDVTQITLLEQSIEETQKTLEQLKSAQSE